jgi:hypothetical protein
MSAIFRLGRQCLLSSIYRQLTGGDENSVTTTNTNQTAISKHSLSAYITLFPWIADGTPVMNKQYQ